VVFSITLPPVRLAHRLENGIPGLGAVVGFAGQQAGEKGFDPNLAYLAHHITPGLCAYLVPIQGGQHF
jgi:hypothetical protein